MTREPKVVELESINTNTNTNKGDSYIKNVFDKTLIIIKDKVSVINIRPSTLYLILKYVMEEVEKTPIKGTEQKEMALKLIRALVIDLTENEDEKVLLQLLNDGTISNMIDLIVDATRGNLNINNLTETTSGCLNNCIPYLFGKKNKNKNKE
tara:strand:+ start:461 stop:916 length:456 start_codon:yes stop_codon:yes gene_type:complete